jgi:hypothetical protein
MSILNLVNDDFNRANQTGLGTSTSGDTWAYTTGGGGFSIISNTGQTTLNTADVAYIDSGVVTCSVYFKNTSSVLTNTGLACRIVDNNNFIIYTNFGQLVKKQGGSFTVLANEGTQYVQNDIVRIDDDGSTIKCYINGSLKITYNTTLFNTYTKQGLYWGAGGSPNFMIDDYNVDITVVDPTITDISPNTGTTAGGTAITITGTEFATNATVTFGGVSATSITVVSATEITCVTPAGTAGVVDVVVTNTDTGTVTSVGGFTYVSATGAMSVIANSNISNMGSNVKRVISNTNIAGGF